MDNNNYLLTAKQQASCTAIVMITCTCTLRLNGPWPLHPEYPIWKKTTIVWVLIFLNPFPGVPDFFGIFSLRELIFTSGISWWYNRCDFIKLISMHAIHPNPRIWAAARSKIFSNTQASQKKYGPWPYPHEEGELKNHSNNKISAQSSAFQKSSSWKCCRRYSPK